MKQAQSAGRRSPKAWGKMAGPPPAPVGGHLYVDPFDGTFHRYEFDDRSTETAVRVGQAVTFAPTPSIPNRMIHADSCECRS
jgi:hypothetical protein